MTRLYETPEITKHQNRLLFMEEKHIPGLLEFLVNHFQEVPCIEYSLHPTTSGVAFTLNEDYHKAAHGHLCEIMTIERNKS